MATIVTETQNHPVRMMIDTGSELTFVCESLVNQLNLKRSKSAVDIIGIGGKLATQTKGKVTLNLNSNYRKLESTITAHILPSISVVIPATDIDIAQHHWPHLEHLKLADAEFNIARKVQLIIGADLYPTIIKSNVIKHSKDSVVAQLSIFGWLVLGPVNSQNNVSSLCYHTRSIISNMHLDNSLKLFWEQEEPPNVNSSSLSSEEQECEDHFRTTHTRDSSGRYIVRIPLKEAVSNLGTSYNTAHQCLQRTLKRFGRNAEYKTLYRQFLQEYEQLGHMSKVPSHSKFGRVNYYLPHHGVLKPDSTSTKLRVVFNGSSVTSSNKSLNDIMHAGPNMLLNIVDVLTWIRSFRHLFSTDITKMFRQIKVHSEDWDLQRILWVNNQGEEEHYHLTTVTYGTKAAPYLAVRTLVQLAEDEGQNYPLAIPSILQGRYVDDIFGGADTVEQLLEISSQLKQLCMAGGFPLAKWHSTTSKLALETVSHVTSPHSISFDNCNTKILGINWSPQEDTFTFQTMSPSPLSKYTKRQVLSEIATIFDPLGFASPVIIRAKILMQQLWLLKIGWDEELPLSVISKWETIRKDLTDLTRLSIPRWFNTLADTSVELHGFSDASQLAMAAAIYITVNSSSTGPKTTLICSKTKVAPLNKMTIPRLELTAALLLAKLVSHFRSKLQFNIQNIYLWTDSTVTLTWIKTHPSRWKEFVQNRVRQIQELTKDTHWRHIPGTQNPADCASRGVSARHLEEHDLWWTGPPWLSQSKSSWPKQILEPDESCAQEARPGITLTSIQKPCEYRWNLIHRYSTLTKLINVTSNCLKFISLLKDIAMNTATSQENARKFWIKATQAAFFSNEMKGLLQQQQLPSAHPLSRLTAFIDADGILRVGGRLENSELSYEAKHPAILPRASRLSELIIEHSHQRTLHGGTQLTLGHLRQRYWIIGGRASVKSKILKCVTCTRQRGIRVHQQMGQLPLSRVTPARPFSHTGIDYAGPLTLKTWKGRGSKTFKGWICVFVCMTTSAAHLELVSDCSTDGFIATYRRFISRRGLPSHLYSDCGTNFVGADKEISRLFKQYTHENRIIQSITTADSTRWHFNPPAAPHMGGKWEALVKSIKFHLKRTIGESLLTFEEISTLLTQIEAILNSRPLEPLSDDPSDLSTLTPGHFLIGSSLHAIPEPSLLDLSTSRLSRWQFIQQRVQQFWKQWSSQYLQRQQAISKWHHATNLIQTGTLVLISDERAPPCRWPLARVISTIPGKDGHIRVVELKTATTTLTRPVSKLVVLPVPTPDKSATDC